MYDTILNLEPDQNKLKVYCVIDSRECSNQHILDTVITSLINMWYVGYCMKKVYCVIASRECSNQHILDTVITSLINMWYVGYCMKKVYCVIASRVFQSTHLRYGYYKPYKYVICGYCMKKVNRL